MEDLGGNNNYNFSFIIVGFLAVGVLLFPLGLDSPFARDVCGLEAKMFAADECQVAWGYVLAIMTVSLTIFCPILGKYSTESKDNYKGVANTGTYSDYDYQKSEIASLTASSTSTRSNDHSLMLIERREKVNTVRVLQTLERIRVTKRVK